MCVIDMCVGVPCPGTQTCNSVTGVCEGDPCVGLHCPTMTMCTDGECVRMTMPGPDSGVTPDSGVVRDGGADASTTTHDERHRVLASGGGPICSVDLSRHDAGGSTRAILALLALAGVVVRRRARRGGGR
jgi:hypothetical protein